MVGMVEIAIQYSFSENNT